MLKSFHNLKTQLPKTAKQRPNEAQKVNKDILKKNSFKLHFMKQRE